MRTRFSIGLALLLCSGVALADRQPGWDFGGELLYQFSQDVDFEGGSKADLDDDLGLALSLPIASIPASSCCSGWTGTPTTTAPTSRRRPYHRAARSWERDSASTARSRPGRRASA